MRSIYPTVYFISSDDMPLLERGIKSIGVAYKRVKGGYTMINGDKIEEDSLCVITEDKDSIIKLGRLHGQEALLKLDKSRNGSIIKLDDLKEIYIGQWIETSKDEAQSSSGYTYDPTENKYYTCKK